MRAIFTVLLGLGALIGGVLGFAIAIAATVALGPLCWVPYLLIYLLLRVCGLTPRQLRRYPVTCGPLPPS